MKGDIMDNILYEKPKGHVKKMAVAGIIVTLAFLAFYVLIEVKSYEIMTQVYSITPTGLDFASDFLSINGLFSIAALVFFFGMFFSKKRAFFMTFMLWAMLLTNLYFVMPKIATLVQAFSSVTGLQLIYYIGLILPQAIVSALLVAFILQKDSAVKKTSGILAWISVIAGAVLFVFQIIYSAGQFTGTDVITDMSSLWGAVAILVLVCLSAVLLMASKNTVLAKEEKEEDDAQDAEDPDEQLDEVVEKIAQQVCKGEDQTEETDSKDDA
jgi:membrane protein implicated in regulation of membrane protease activity